MIVRAIDQNAAHALLAHLSKVIFCGRSGAGMPYDFPAIAVGVKPLALGVTIAHRYKRFGFTIA